MKNITLENVANACNGKLVLINGDDATKEAVSVVIDSRKCEEGSIFIATRGEKVDGHSFINQVFEKGALAVVCEDEPEGMPGNYIVVKDSFQAIKDIARFYRQQLSVKIVGVAGSVGKTSTKQLVASVLSEKYKVQKTVGNLNNEIGVPLTIFSIDESHEMAVVEMGISDFGEMSRLSDIVKPDICLMTNIGPCHLENLKDLDGVLKAKSEIFESMNKKGYVVVNGDDEKLYGIKRVNEKTPTYFGISEHNDIYAKNIVSKGVEGSTCTICTKQGNFEVKVPLPGIHMVINAVAATSVGLLVGLTLDEIKAGIEKVESVNGRSNIIHHEKYVVIDDCYNANPKSMKAAIDLLCQSGNSRKIAILGDMFELGVNEEALHGEVGSYANEKNVDTLICIGSLASNIYEKADAVSDRYYYEKLEDFLSSSKIKESADKPIILIKASHGMHFEKIVEFLTN